MADPDNSTAPIQLAQSPLLPIEEGSFASLNEVHTKAEEQPTIEEVGARETPRRRRLRTPDSPNTPDYTPRTPTPRSPLKVRSSFGPDDGGALLSATEALLRALDPSNLGFVCVRDFRLVLALAGRPGVTRKEQRELDVLVAHYKIPPPPLRHLSLVTSPQAEEALAAAAASVDPEAAWPMHYERFLLDARVSRLEGAEDLNVPPLAPWADEQRRKSQFPPALAVSTRGAPGTGGPGAERHDFGDGGDDDVGGGGGGGDGSGVGGSAYRGWEAHAKGFTRRRVAACGWLMGRGAAALRMLQTRGAAQRRLEQDSERAQTTVSLRAMARVAGKQVSAQDKCKRWLHARMVRAARHTLRRGEAYRLLSITVARSVAQALAGGYEHTNVGRAWERRHHMKQAGRWLGAVGALTTVRARERFAALEWLHWFGARSKAALRPMLEQWKSNAAFGRKALKARRNREAVLDRLFKQAIRAERTRGHMQKEQAFLASRGELAMAKKVPVAGSVAWLMALGQGVKAMVFRDQLAAIWLVETGAASAVHLVAQNRARAFLRRRTADAARSTTGMAASIAHLHALSRDASAYQLGPARQAGLFLRRRCHAVRAGHGAARAFARTELLELADFTRRARAMDRAAVAHPGRLAELTAAVRAEDRRKEAERKGLSSGARLMVEMRDAFEGFDLDRSGEINRLEFRSLVKGGQVVKVPMAEVADVFKQMDVDSSGAVSFDEFWAWLQFEATRGGSRRAKTVTAADIISARTRAAQRLLAEIEAGGVPASAANAAPEFLAEPLAEHLAEPVAEPVAEPLAKPLVLREDAKGAGKHGTAESP